MNTEFIQDSFRAKMIQLQTKSKALEIEAMIKIKANYNEQCIHVIYADIYNISEQMTKLIDRYKVDISLADISVSK